MSITHVTDDNFKETVLDEKEKLVLVDFWAEWCGPCRALSPIIESLSKKMTSVKVCKIDTDANQNTAQNYEITGIPCCLIFKNGEEVKRIMGYKSESAFESELTALI